MTPSVQRDTQLQKDLRIVRFALAQELQEFELELQAISLA